MFQRNQNRFSTLFLKVKQQSNSAAIRFPQICYESIFVISSFSQFMKLSHLCGEYVSMLFLTRHERG